MDNDPLANYNMKNIYHYLIFLYCLLSSLPVFSTVVVQGELKKWHKVTLVVTGPTESETGLLNPFTDYRLNVTFSLGSKTYVVPGYFAADGDAANTGATSGNVWLVHFSPDSVGTWSYQVSFRSGTKVAIDTNLSAGIAVAPDGTTGTFLIEANDKSLPDLRAKGRLEYVNKHYLQWKETGEYYIKGGADSPENFLGYYGFDNTADSGGVTTSLNGTASFTSAMGSFLYAGDGLHHFEPHATDWNTGDPDWGGGKGEAIIGALNYLSSKGMNTFSFLTMNIIGDGREVFPYVNYNGQAAPQDDRLRFDCSKLAQWEMVFEHAQNKGLNLSFKTQERENDDLLDGGIMGDERKMYYRELIARFSHHLAISWNLGEEYDAMVVLNDPQLLVLKACAQYFRDTDPYDHHIVVHTYPNEWNLVYTPMLGTNSVLTGTSLQVDYNEVHQLSLDWINKSDLANKPWVVANDEQGSANDGVRPMGASNNFANIRKYTIWGNLTAGGGGNELYFGYAYTNSDLNCEDWRSRETMWDYVKIAVDFFSALPITEMANHDELIANPTNTNDRYCFAKPGENYVIYLPDGGTVDLDLTLESGIFDVFWFNPRTAGSLALGPVTTVYGGAIHNLGIPPSDITNDWVAWVIYQGPSPLASAWGNLKALQHNDAVVLEWIDQELVNLDRFEVFRKIPSGNWEHIGDRRSQPNGTDNFVYSFQDQGLTVGNWYYQVRKFDLEGKENRSPVVEVLFQETNPLFDIQPNPFSDFLHLSFSDNLPQGANLSISTLEGKVVKSHILPSGQYTFDWNLDALAPGIYYLKINVAGEVGYSRVVKL